MNDLTPSVNDRRKTTLGRMLVWLAVAVALGLTYAAYGQMELMLQWVTARLC
ncbi:MAG TPA: hypothetical protein PLJ16_11955 [Casimicrobium huifangae]|uniref:hypothetical protein n=1 Tax=Casimicrobium huifangae TaxID=2591109 RepID=UPI0012EB580C|nr:hypothetical protein [Casimicrobium huifangae]HOB00453.1 hypothetical protein [Casimicrobium huifangae]HQA32770.1 hypothetical protein [Casimicrobium huifangae]HQD65936.1 hypothetical protein [Casimicrobium huifangae]